MLIILKNIKKIPIKTLKAEILFWAKFKLYTYKYGPVEINLENYLREKYNLTLKEACWKIVQNCSFSQDNQNNMIITLLDRELDKIASVINYGFDGKCGSMILKYILRI